MRLVLLPIAISIGGAQMAMVGARCSPPDPNNREDSRRVFATGPEELRCSAPCVRHQTRRIGKVHGPNTPFSFNRLSAMEWSGKQYLVCDGQSCSGTSWLWANRLQKKSYCKECGRAWEATYHSSGVYATWHETPSRKG